ncbi:MAG: XRE family transcriptional regulator [Clostridiales bacterium]|jgi:transcriptional regulator with XRE-family HTH domain|nr:XRE family transcriptional regulator [Clostridiales bacterium]
MQDDVSDVSRRLRELRESCGTPAEELAASLGVPAAIYAGYEDGSQDIPISALYKLTGLLGADLTELLTGNSPKLDTYCVVRHGQGLSIDRYPGYKFKSVAFNFQHRKMEPLIVHLDAETDAAGVAGAAGAATGLASAAGAHKELVAHTGQEFNYVIEGTVRLTLGKKEIILNRGDCCYFDPTIPHGQSAVDRSAEFLTVILE